jgi:hypothetical protein
MGPRPGGGLTAAIRHGRMDHQIRVKASPTRVPARTCPWGPAIAGAASAMGPWAGCMMPAGERLAAGTVNTGGSGAGPVMVPAPPISMMSVAGSCAAPGAEDALRRLISTKPATTAMTSTRAAATLAIMMTRLRLLAGCCSWPDPAERRAADTVRHCGQTLRSDTVRHCQTLCVRGLSATGSLMPWLEYAAGTLTSSAT